MIINHDRSYQERDARMWIDAHLAVDTVHSLRFSYRFADEDERREALDCMGRSSEEQEQIRHGNDLKRNDTMRAIMDDIATHFIVFQYNKEEPMSFDSTFWELFFWCNDRKVPPYGRDYSYFTLGFNCKQPAMWRMLICKRVLEHLQKRYAEHPNLEVAVQYDTWYDTDRIAAEARKATEVMKDRTCEFNDRQGKLVLSEGRLWFKPRYARTRVHYVSDTELLRILWDLEPKEEPSGEENRKQEVH